MSAPLRQGLLIVSDCRRGICGACRAFLVDGEYDELLAHNVHALSDDEEQDGWVLSCRLRPRSDLRLEFDYPVDRVARLSASRRAARVLRSESACGGFVRLVAKTAAVHSPLTWTAGQHVLINRPGDRVAYRAFPASNAGSSFEVELLLMLPRAFVDAPVFADGEAFVVEGPFGDFGLLPGSGDRFFIAGREGLPPVAALMQSLSNDPGGRATLVFAGERGIEAALRMLGGAKPALRFGLDAIADLVGIPQGVQLYLCGPPTVNAAARTVLKTAGAQHVIASEIDRA